MTDRGRRIARRIVFVCEAVAVVVWFLLALANLWGVPWFDAHQLGLDGIFLAAVMLVVAIRFIERRGLAQAAVVAVALGLAGGAAAIGEFTLQYMYRNVHSSGVVGDYFGWHAKRQPVAVNQLGFREREIPPKRPGRYRIAVIGDSFTWGQGIAESARFSNLVEQDLGPEHYEVFNFGILAANMPEHLERLPLVLSLDPNFVLLQLDFNDFEMPEMTRPQAYPLVPPSLNADFERTSAAYSLLNAQWARLQETLGIIESRPAWEARNLLDPNSPNSKKGFGMLRDFIDEARNAKVGVGIVFFPFPDRLGHNGADYPYHFLHDRVTGICGEKQIPCVDLLAAFSTFKDPRVMWVSPFDAHPNELANRRAAYEIMARFGPIWQGGMPDGR